MRMPADRRLADQVWHDVNLQVANYVRGKVWEIVIVGAVTFATFSLMGLQYALLLATMVGLSVIIPYIGAAVATVPVAIIAWFQWGWSADFAWVILAYGVIQALDGNLLVPLLFSEVVNLHPVAIIIAVLVFGGIWGLWGVFFAIPLATLVQAVLNAWPRKGAEDEAPVKPLSA
jgi:putative permease